MVQCITICTLTEEIQVKNNYNETNFSQCTQYEELIPQRSDTDVSRQWCEQNISHILTTLSYILI